jgi:drug/metabolite transporter (DMT)-like permease
MIYIPFLGALALGVGTILEKITLKDKKLDIKLYQTAGFLAIVLAIIPFLLFSWKITPEAYSLKNLLILLGLVLVSIIANMLVFYSIKGEKVTALQPTRALEPILTILLSLIFGLFISGIYEGTSGKIIIPALIASLAVVFPHIRKEHLHLNKYLLASIGGSFFFALELVMSKLILNYYSPITFYFFRCLLIFFISWMIFRPDFKKLDKKSTGLILITGLVWVVYRVAIYFGYIKYGIIFTTLITLMAPILVYLLAHVFLREKPNWKNILSSLIIVSCVLYSVLT